MIGRHISHSCSKSYKGAQLRWVQHPSPSPTSRQHLAWVGAPGHQTGEHQNPQAGEHASCAATPGSVGPLPSLLLPQGPGICSSHHLQRSNVPRPPGPLLSVTALRPPKLQMGQTQALQGSVIQQQGCLEPSLTPVSLITKVSGRGDADAGAARAALMARSLWGQKWGAMGRGPGIAPSFLVGTSLEASRRA